jgi:acyl carrier protein phosphodiesterase
VERLSFLRGPVMVSSIHQGWSLDGAAGRLAEHYAALDADFCAFFPELKAHIDGGD